MSTERRPTDLDRSPDVVYGLRRPTGRIFEVDYTVAYAALRRGETVYERSGRGTRAERAARTWAPSAACGTDAEGE